MRRLSLSIELRDTGRDATARDELIREGGKRTVPCLRIEDEGLPSAVALLAELQEEIRRVFAILDEALTSV